MTFSEMFGVYGMTPLYFTNYYKYTFTYTGRHDPTGVTIVVKYGGNSEDIYRHEVSKDSAESIGSLAPNQITLYKDGKEIFYWNDY